MTRIFPSQIEKEKSLIRVEQSHKTADQVVLAIDGVANPKITKAADQEPAINIVKIPYHTRWWQAQDEPPMQKVATAMISMII